MVDKKEEKVGDGCLNKRYICCILIALMSVALFGGFVLLLYLVPAKSYVDSILKDEPNFCDPSKNATDSITVSANWSQLIDLKADPCQDFYMFACGLQKPIKPKCSVLEDKKQTKKIMNKMGMFGPQDEIQKCLNDSIYDIKSNGSTAIQKFQVFRDAHVKKNKKDMTFDELIQDVKSFGGCPAIKQTQWDPNNFDLVQALQTITNSTADMRLFKWNIGRLENSTFVLTIEAEDSDAFEYSQEQSDTLGSLFGLLSAIDDNSNSNENYTEIANDIVDLYDSVLEIYAKFNESEKKKFDEYGFELPKSTDADLDAVPFSSINDALPVVGTHYFSENIHVFPQMRSFLSTNPFIHLKTKQLLFELNDFYAQLETNEMANFLCAQYLMVQLNYLNFESLNETHPGVVSDFFEDTQTREDEDDNLLDKMTEEFPQIVDHLFIGHCLAADTYDRIQLMLNEIKFVLFRTIERQSWMDSKSKDSLLHKLNKTKINILATNLVRDVKKLDQFYEILHFDKGDSARQMQLKLNLVIYHQNLELAFNDEYSDLIEVYSIRASDTNAGYLAVVNSLSIYAGILFPPSYQPNSLDALNYGGIGTIIGHEFSHAFHLLGQRFGSLGERTQLFTPQTTHSFFRRSQCFIDQYNQFEDKEVGEFLKKHGEKIRFVFKKQKDSGKFSIDSYLNGTRTLEENLADNFGIRLAYEAYKMHLNGRIEPPVVEFPQFTNDQAFFITFGSLWCNNFSLLERFLLLIEDIHSPAKIRLNNALQNFVPFSQAFNCPIGSPMNPVKKCQIWE